MEGSVTSAGLPPLEPEADRDEDEPEERVEHRGAPYAGLAAVGREARRWHPSKEGVPTSASVHRSTKYVHARKRPIAPSTA